MAKKEILEGGVEKHEWVTNFPAIVVVCDTEGVILEMNREAISHFAEQGGEGLIGRNLFECHSEPSGERIRTLMAERITDVHTFKRHGVGYLTIKGPWYRPDDGELGGLVEIVLALPSTSELA